MRALAVGLALLPLVGGAMLPVLSGSFAADATNGAGQGGRDADPVPGHYPRVDHPMFRGDERRSGHAMGAELPSRVVEAWRLDAFNPGKHTAAKGSAAAVDGVFYVGSDDGTLSAIDENGTVRWRAATGPSGNGIHGTPAVEGDQVIVGAYDGVLYSFARGDGALQWSAKLGDHIGSSPLVWEDRVYVSVETDIPSGIVVLLDLEGNVLAQDDSLGSHPHSSVAVDAELGRVVVGDNTGALTIWDLDLRRTAEFHAGDDIKGPIAVWNGSAVFGSWDHHVYRVDLLTGKEVWSFPTLGWVMSGAAVGPDGTVYIGAHDGHLYGLAGHDGTLLWAAQVGDRILGSPFLADGKVLVGAHSGYLVCLDADDGRPVWRHRVGGQVTGSPVVHGDLIVVASRRVGDEGGDLVAVRAA